jgi:hypothetical protein
MSMHVEIEEPERQTIILALAKLLFDRPGWAYHINEIADKLDGREMLSKFWNLEEKNRGQQG